MDVKRGNGTANTCVHIDMECQLNTTFDSDTFKQYGGFVYARKFSMRTKINQSDLIQSHLHGVNYRTEKKKKISLPIGFNTFGGEILVNLFIEMFENIQLGLCS